MNTGPFNIEFDYRFDTFGFFTPNARAALEAAASIWEGVIQDEFPNFRAGQTFDVGHPETGARVAVTLTQDIDDLLIFVGSRDLIGPFGALATGGSDGYSAVGDVNYLRFAQDFRSRGPTTDFEPYVGVMNFDRDTSWSYQVNTPEVGKPDFISVALHEIGHVLGLGASATFDSFVDIGVFTGPNAKAVTNGVGIPLNPAFNHIGSGLVGGPAVMEPSLQYGTRTLPTDLDKAILADIGYEIKGFSKQGSPFALATDSAETIAGTSLSDVIDALGGDDFISGLEGDDHLRGGSGANDLSGGEGTDRFYLGVGDGQSRLIDFDFANEKIVIDPAFGLSSASDVFSLVTKPFSNVSELILPGQASVFIFHNNTGSLSAANVEFGVLPSTPTGQTTVTDTNDLFTATAGPNSFDGGGGVDTVALGIASTDATISFSKSGVVTITDRNGTGGADTLTNIEIAQFTDTTIDLTNFVDLTGLSSAQFAELAKVYVAYFNRAADAKGLYFWADKLGEGMSLIEIAGNFALSAEANALYPDTSNTQAFVTAVYANVLGRTPDSAGFAFWKGHLDAGTQTAATFVLSIIGGAQGTDITYLANKADLGVYFSAIKGMSDVIDAQNVMNMFGDQATSNTAAAKAAVDSHYIDATAAGGGDNLIELVGIAADPFASFIG